MKAIIGVLVVLVTMSLFGCGAPEQVEVTTLHGYSGGMEQRIARLRFIADEPLPVGKVVFNDGTCRSYYEGIGHSAEGLTPAKGKVLTVSAPVCNGGGPIYKVEYITQDGQSWTYNIE